MRRQAQEGFTLVEVLITATIMGIIAAAMLPLLSICLQTHAQGVSRARLYHEGLLAMERMTDGVARSTHLLIPNNQTPVRDMLAFSGFINDDGDSYFGDPLFPRIDEDAPRDSNADGGHGIEGVDDDGDGSVDEYKNSWQDSDDDEDAFWNWEVDNDPLDGVDNDDDGTIDEDLPGDMNGDGRAGIAGVDDDGDTLVDENGSGVEGAGDPSDDDEDGLLDEDPLNEIIYIFDSATSTLRESIPLLGQTRDLATHVTAFAATYVTPDRIQIALTLSADDGETISFLEYVYPRNTRQKTGKRVR